MTHLQPRDLALRNIAQVHQEAANGVFAARNQHLLVLIDGVLRDPLHEIGHRPIHAVFETLGLGDLPQEQRLALLDRPNRALLDRVPDVPDVLVLRVVSGVVLGEQRDGRGRTS